MATSNAAAQVEATRIAVSKAVSAERPGFIERMNADYKAKVAHVFLIHGNINDFPDNTGTQTAILRTFALEYDHYLRRDLKEAASPEESARGEDFEYSKADISSPSILATFSLGSGLNFLHTKSKEVWMEFLKSFYGEQTANWRDDWDKPSTIDELIWIMNKWFHATKEVVRKNGHAKRMRQSTQNEVRMTLVFPNADVLFPTGQVANMSGDRLPIVSLREWAADEKLGDRNRLILMVQHVSDIHDSIRGGVGVATHLIPKPNLDDRETWLTNFNQWIIQYTKDKTIDGQAVPGSVVMGNKKIKQVNLAEGFTIHDFAVQAAGMSRRQMKDVIMESWRSDEPVDFVQVRTRKRRALEDEYEGLVDFFEPEYGFEIIGGHEKVKDYFRHNIIEPLRRGDKRMCSRGVLLTGPPGTGKTQLAKALAKEAKMNFMIGHLDKLFGGLVGETEKKTSKFLEAVEAAAPVILFLDELDSVLSSGRQSHGDSGVSGRVFNSVMQFLSDDGRAGKVVVVSASNRPDLLDSALIRSGRFDAKVSVLPPGRQDAKGRLLILDALCKKFDNLKLSSLKGTQDDPGSGLGLLCRDTERTWTGAEIEVVLKKALAVASREAAKGDKPAIKLLHWDKAFKAVIPNTQEVERMTLLSLLYVDDLEYCPDEWVEQAKDKKKLRADLKDAGWDEDED